MATTYYSDPFSNTAPGRGTLGSSQAQDLRHFSQDFTHTAPAGWAAGDIVRFGPFRAGEKIRSESLKLTGDGTGTLGTTVDVGWAYVDGTGTADPDAFGTAVSCTAAAVDDAGIVAYDVATPGPRRFAQPPTNDRDWWLTVTSVNAASDVAGVVGVVGDVVGFR